MLLAGILIFLFFRLFAVFVIPPNGDEIAHLYISQDIAHFVRFPIYFYRQAVMGALESYFLAPVVGLFGVTVWGSRLFYGLFYFSFAGMYLGTVRRLFSRELTTYLFILLTVLPFPALFFTTLIGWNEVLVFALLSLVLLLKITEAPEKSLGPALALGFVSGIALWCNPLFVIWMVPIGISLSQTVILRPVGPKDLAAQLRDSSPLSPAPPASRTQNDVKLLLLFFLGLGVGLFPVWLSGLQTGVFMNLSDRGGRGALSIENLPQVIYLFFARLKYFLSTFSFGSVSGWADGLIRGLSFIPLSVFLISFASLAFHFLRSFRTLSVRERAFYNFILVPPLLFFILYCSRDFTAKDEGMRFFVQLIIPYVFVVAWWLERLHRKIWKRGFLGLLVGVLLLGNFYSAGEIHRRGEPVRKLLEFLEKEGLHYGIADIGTAYPLNVLSRHQIIATPLPHHVVSDSIWKKVKDEGPRFLILERENPQLRRVLEKDARLKRQTVGAYDIFYGDSDFLANLLDVQEPVLG